MILRTLSGIRNFGSRPARNAARRVSAVRWKVANNIVIAWIITIPASALIAAIAYAIVGLLE